MKSSKKNFAVISIIFTVLAIVFAAISFAGNILVYSIFPMIIATIISIITGVRAVINSKNKLSIAALVISIVVAIPVIIFFEMLFEYLFIL